MSNKEVILRPPQYSSYVTKFIFLKYASLGITHIIKIIIVKYTIWQVFLKKIILN